MYSYSPRVRQILNKWPGKKTFGIYRFLPVYFFFGAVLEFAMIHLHVGEVNFYKTFKRRQVQDIVERRLRETSLQATRKH